MLLDEVIHLAVVLAKRPISEPIHISLPYLVDGQELFIMLAVVAVEAVLTNQTGCVRAIGVHADIDY